MQASIVAVHGLRSCGAWALEQRLSSCGTPAQLLCSMWNLPPSEVKPVSKALAVDSLPLSHLGGPIISPLIDQKGELGR